MRLDERLNNVIRRIGAALVAIALCFASPGYANASPDDGTRDTSWWQDVKDFFTGAHDTYTVTGLLMYRYPTGYNGFGGQAFWLSSAPDMIMQCGYGDRSSPCPILPQGTLVEATFVVFKPLGLGEPMMVSLEPKP